MKTTASKIIKKGSIPLIAAIIITAAVMVLPIRGESEIYDKVIRLHVLANSDSQEDQELKLTVRDAILSDVAALTEGCSTREQAEEKIRSSLDSIREKAEDTLQSHGCDYPVTVTLSKENYPTREYEDMRFPAGEYSSLRIMIGEAKGQNWWCVLFPPLCVGAASAKDELVSAGFTPGQVRLLTDNDSPTYVLRFRVLEWLEGLFG